VAEARLSEYVELARRWAEVTKLVAAGKWDGIRCPKNNDANVLIDVRILTPKDTSDNRRYEYWLHCPGCGAEVYFHSQDEYRPDPKQE
jgi:hypothetical protein